jgi:uncharacterized protein YbjT (DUF2867 family)
VKRVLVLGASGTLGRRIVRLLGEERTGALVVGAGRRPERLSTPEARRLDRREPASFEPALRGVAVLVHAAGPFDHDPKPLVRACLASGVHYVDLAEDASFLAGVRAAAREVAGNATVVPGCSTVPGLIALLARRFEDRAAAVRIDAHLCLGSRNPVSAALLWGLLRPIGSAAPDGARWFRSLHRFAFSDGTIRSFGSYPAAFGEGLPLGGRRVAVRLFVGFDRAFLNRLLVQAGYVIPHLSPAVLRGVARLALPVAHAARGMGTFEGRLALTARDAGGTSLGEVEVRAAREGLDVPAAPAVWAVQRLLSENADLPKGVVGLEQLVSIPAALDWFAAHGVTITESAAQAP